MIVLSLVFLAVAGVLLVAGIFQGPDGTALLVASIAATLAAAGLLYLGVRSRTAAADPAKGPAKDGATGRGERPGSGGTAGKDRAGTLVTAKAGGAPPKGGTAARGTRAAAESKVAPPRVGAGTASGSGTGSGIGTGTGAAASGAAAASAAALGTAAQGVAAAAPAAASPAAGGTGAVVAAGAAVAGTAATTSSAPSGATAAAGGAGQEADDDPPDEPGIEKVSLGELARIAGREDEVVVVDGRPRYHVTTCTHLVAREWEGLPVSEAAELGFTPCDRCRPVAALLARSGG